MNFQLRNCSRETAPRNRGRTDYADFNFYDQEHFANNATLLALKAIGEASTLVHSKADAAEAAAYDEFVVTAASAVASAHKEHGQAVSEKEQAALDEVRGRLAASS